MLKRKFTIPMNMYSGKDNKKKIKAKLKLDSTIKLEEYMNKKIEDADGEKLVLDFSTIASESGLYLSTVEDLLQCIQGGHTGITIDVRNYKE